MHTANYKYHEKSPFSLQEIKATNNSCPHDLDPFCLGYGACLCFTKHTIHISFFALENWEREVGEMAHWLSALYALAEGPGSVPSTRL